MRRLARAVLACVATASLSLHREVERNTWAANYMNSARDRKLFEADHAEFKAMLADLGPIK